MYKFLTTCFAMFTPNAGERNQIKGLVVRLVRENRNNKKISFAFSWDMFVNKVCSGSLRYNRYKNKQLFDKDVFKCLDAYFANRILPPRVFITACDQSEGKFAGQNTDELCRAVKEYYAKNHKGWVVAVVLTACAYNYKWADVVNVPEHMLSAKEAKFVKSMPEKFLMTTGIIHNMTKVFIAQKFGQQKLKQAINNIKGNNPIAVFSLGGRTGNDDIVFDIGVCKKIWNKALVLREKGCNVVFISGPRTPDEVCDFLYEKCLENKKMYFYNGKPLENKGKKMPEWRVYAGKYKKELTSQYEDVGNIYPGILGKKKVFVVHTFDSFASCETAACGIPTLICRDVKIKKRKRPDCYRLAEALISGGYAGDFDDFLKQNSVAIPKFKTLPSINGLISEKVTEACLRYKNFTK